MKKSKANNYLFPMIVMSILFFMVGFITTMNNSLIDFLASSKWMLSFSDKQLVNTAFFGAYLFSIPLSVLLNKLGYKASAVLSLFVISVGFLLVYPAVAFGYSAFLASMFIVALGVTLLQIVLNPYVLALGTPDKAASRLNLAGFLNSVATVIAPMFVAVIISTGNIAEDAPIEMRPAAANVQIPFLIISGITLALCVILYFLRLPEIKEDSNTGDECKYLDSPYKYPHLLFGAIAIFVYMGVEIGIPSFLPDRMRALGVEQINLFGYNFIGTEILSLYWGGLMIGRLFGFVIMQKVKARAALLTCAIVSAMLLLLSLGTIGRLSICLMISCGLFHSIMWANIFNLASKELGPHTKRASGIICSFAIGGALLPLLMGALQQSFGTDALGIGTVAAFCCLFIYYAYIGLFAVKLSKIRPKL